MNNTHLSGLIFRQAEKYGEKAALRYRNDETKEWLSISWNKFAEKVKTVAKALFDSGLQEQQNVGIFSQNAVEIILPEIGSFAGLFLDAMLEFQGNILSDEHVAVQRRRMPREESQVFVPQDNGSTSTCVYGREHRLEVDHGNGAVDHSAEGSVGQRDFATERDERLIDDASHDRIGHDQFIVAVIAQVYKVRAIADVCFRSRRHTAAVDDIAIRVDHAQAAHA